MAGNHDLKRIRICLPMRQARILIVFVIANKPSTIPSSPTSFVAAIFSTLSGKYSRIVASSQRNHLGCAGRLCRSVVIGRSLSVVVIVLFRTMTTINFDRSNASSLKSTIDRGLG